MKYDYDKVIENVIIFFWKCGFYVVGMCDI